MGTKLKGCALGTGLIRHFLILLIRGIICVDQSVKRTHPAPGWEIPRESKTFDITSWDPSGAGISANQGYV